MKTRFLIALVVLTSCSKSTGDRMSYQELRDIAGADAIDCGHVPLKGVARAANECALSAFKRSHSFLVRYEVPGIDSQVVYGLASRGDGHVFDIKFDSEGWDTHGLGPEATVKNNNHLLVKPCPQPAVLSIDDRLGILSCAK